jgi:hypothetical protein
MATLTADSSVHRGALRLSTSTLISMKYHVDSQSTTSGKETFVSPASVVQAPGQAYDAVPSYPERCRVGVLSVCHPGVVSC